MANYHQELAHDAACQSHAGHMTGLWFLPVRSLRLNTNEWYLKVAPSVLVTPLKYYIYIPCHGSENWTLTLLRRRRTEAAEMELVRPLAGYTLYDHKTNDYIRRELRITGILDKIDEYRRKWFQHLQRMPQNRIPLKSYYYRPQGRKQLEDRRNVGESSCNFGDGTDQRVQSLMFMMMMISCPHASYTYSPSRSFLLTRKRYLIQQRW